MAMNVRSKPISKKPPAARRGAPVGIGLSRESVIASALELIDRKGLESFSIRNLAKELNVNPTAVMWHIGSRSELLNEVYHLVQADLLPSGPMGTWQEWTRQVFHLTRAAIARHPNVAPLIGAQLVPDLNFDYDMVETLLRTLSDAGFSGQTLISAYNVVLAGAVSFPTLELAPVPAEDGKEWEAGMRSRLLAADKRLYPHLVANLPNLMNKAFMTRWQNGVEMPMSETFDFYVDTIVAGLEVMLLRQDESPK